MKTSKILVSLLLLSVLLTPALALGQNTGGPGVTFSGLDDLITKVGDFLWKIVGLVALILFVIAGIMFMTAMGDPAKIATARNFVLWGVVGIIVAILAYSIVAIVTNIVGG